MSSGHRGTSVQQDARLKDKTEKLKGLMKFPTLLTEKLNIKLVNLEVMRPWITQKLIDILGFDDDVCSELVVQLLEQEVDAKDIQIQLTGFLEENTFNFMKELWQLLLSAQKSASGIPQAFLEAKKEEIRLQREKDAAKRAADSKLGGDAVRSNAPQSASGGGRDDTGSGRDRNRERRERGRDSRGGDSRGGDSRGGERNRSRERDRHDKSEREIYRSRRRRSSRDREGSPLPSHRRRSDYSPRDSHRRRRDDDRREGDRYHRGSGRRERDERDGRDGRDRRRDSRAEDEEKERPVKKEEELLEGDGPDKIPHFHEKDPEERERYRRPVESKDENVDGVDEFSRSEKRNKVSSRDDSRERRSVDRPGRGRAEEEQIISHRRRLDSRSPNRSHRLDSPREKDEDDSQKQ